MGRAFLNGWVSLPTHGDLYLEDGLPRRIWLSDADGVDFAGLTAEITALTGLRVKLGAWQVGGRGEGREAPLGVEPADIDKVLLRLGSRAAQTFVDRYQKAIDDDDSDYDEESYAEALQLALAACGRQREEVNTQALHETYSGALHAESERFAQEEKEP